MTPERRKQLSEELQDPRYRCAYFESHMDSSIAAQIKANREDRQMSQKGLAKAAGLFQSQVSKMEDVNHAGWTAKTLRKIARALDVVLVIRLERFSRVMAARHDFPNALVEPPYEKDLPAHPGYREEAADSEPPWPTLWATVTLEPVSTSASSFEHVLALLDSKD